MCWAGPRWRERPALQFALVVVVADGLADADVDPDPDADPDPDEADPNPLLAGTALAGVAAPELELDTDGVLALAGAVAPSTGPVAVPVDGALPPRKSVAYQPVPFN